MAECIQTPSLTSTIERVGQSVFEITLTQESTLPGSTRTITSLTTSCATLNASAVPPETTCTPVEVVTTTTLPGDITEVTLTTETSTPVTSLITTTLFGFSCPPDVPPPPPPSNTPSDETSDTSASSTPSRTSSNSDRTSSPASTGTNAATLPAGANSTGTGTNVAPIVGGAIGGFVGLIAIVALIWYLVKRQQNKRFDGLFDSDELQAVPKPEKHGHGGGYGGDSGKPKPTGGINPPTHHYQDAPTYGGGYQDIGYQGGQYQDQGYQGGQYQDTTYQGGQYQDYAPHNGQNTGYQPTNDVGNYSPDAHHARNPSLAPLLVGASAVATGASLQAAAASSSHLSTTSGRPSTGGSMSPLIQQQQQLPSHQHQAYPPQGQQPLTHYPPNNGPGYYNQSTSPQGYSYPPTNLSHNPSVSTYSSGPAAASAAHGGYGAYGGMAVGAAAGSYAGHERDESVTSIGRTGSPVSISNAQVLQVMNPEASFSAAGGSSHAQAASGSSGSAPVDGKGRPVNLKGEKQPIVHLDGGRYEEPAQAVQGTTQPTAGPAPPAYTT